MARIAIFALAAAAIGFAGGSILFGSHGQPWRPVINALALGCDIKGNISMNTGERIFHVPGQEFYSETVINADKGERWFCSEDEARAAGWRKARQ
jgi:hypothetical protein